MHESITKDLTIESQFINIIQGIESYDRRKQNVNELQNKIRHNLEYIYEQVENKVIKIWLKEKLNYSYEPTLKERLLKYFTEYQNIIFNNPTTKQIENLAKTTKNTRNYYTHYDVSLISKIFSPDVMLRINQVLRNLFIVIVLEELEIQKSLVEGNISEKL
ncbi:hypothetical protein D3C80_1523570 [compost metagenome]